MEALASSGSSPAVNSDWLELSPSCMRAGAGERGEKGQAFSALGLGLGRLGPSERQERERESSWAVAAHWVDSGLVRREKGRRSWAACSVRPDREG
jgi:hypothetical protein